MNVIHFLLEVPLLDVQAQIQQLVLDLFSSTQPTLQVLLLVPILIHSLLVFLVLLPLRLKLAPLQLYLAINLLQLGELR